MTVSQDAVIWAYRLLLGREPETAQIVTAHQKLPSAERLVRDILNSREFLRRISNFGFETNIGPLQVYKGHLEECARQ